MAWRSGFIFAKRMCDGVKMCLRALPVFLTTAKKGLVNKGMLS
jgi:hypothetical protein